MMTYKTIFKGRLEFGSPRSYDKVLKMYQHRVDSYYKSDILLNEEEIFNEEEKCLNVPRFITQGSEKSWKNTVSLLEYVAQFAVSGSLNAWMTDNGKILDHDNVEPKNDRVAVQAFLTGRELSNVQGRESEAMAALNKALEKYEKHAQALERRGYVNYLLRNYKEALRDYSRSIECSQINAEAYLGRAIVKVALKDDETAISDLAHAIKMSIPLQPIYWQARRRKGLAHARLNDHQAAYDEFKLIVRRKFTEENPNYKWRRAHLFYLAQSAIQIKMEDEALEALQSALIIKDGNDVISDGQIQHLIDELNS